MKMNEKELAALERLITAAKAHPFALAVSQQERDENEALARRIGNGEMTKKEARIVTSQLETEAQRIDIMRMLHVLVSKTDSMLLLDYLLRLVKETLAAPEEVIDTPKENAQKQIIFKLHSPRKNYVAFEEADRSGWPAKGQKGKRCNGLLYGCVDGKKPKKIDWIPVGRQNTGFGNALKGVKYYQPDIVPGCTIRFEVRTINGELVNPRYSNTVIYKP